MQSQEIGSDQEQKSEKSQREQLTYLFLVWKVLGLFPSHQDQQD